MVRKKILFLGIFCLNVFALNALSYNIGVKYFGINIHPVGDINAKLMPIKLGDNGFLVPSFGAMVSFETYFWKDLLGVELAAANYTDCAMQYAGFAHLGFRIKFLSKGKHEINGGIGPTFIFRQNWYKVDGYDDTRNFYRVDKTTDDIQWRFIVYGGEFEYDYSLTDKVDFSVTFVPGIPILMTFAFGVRIRR
jgi:hypothetical protein